MDPLEREFITPAPRACVYVSSTHPQLSAGAVSCRCSRGPTGSSSPCRHVHALAFVWWEAGLSPLSSSLRRYHRLTRSPRQNRRRRPTSLDRPCRGTGGSGGVTSGVSSRGDQGGECEFLLWTGRVAASRPASMHWRLSLRLCVGDVVKWRAQAIATSSNATLQGDR